MGALAKTIDRRPVLYVNPFMEHVTHDISLDASVLITRDVELFADEVSQWMSFIGATDEMDLSGLEAAFDAVSSYNPTGLAQDNASIALNDRTQNVVSIRRRASRAERRNANGGLSLLVRDLGRLSNGWCGEDSVAPTERVLLDIQQVLSLVAGEIKVPETEVDPDDGMVVLRWSGEGYTATFSLTFPGTGYVTGYLSKAEKVPAWRYRTDDVLAIARHISSDEVASLILA